MGSPVATLAGSYFEANVFQHLLFMIIAAPLLALGAPSTLLLQSSGRKIKTFWLSVLRSRPFELLTFPVTVWAVYFGAMFAFFLSSLINTAVHHPYQLDLWNLVFLLGATLYWWPLVGVDPIVHWRMGYGSRMLYLLLGAPLEVILGLAILSARSPIASIYSLSSTHAGGALLWISTEVAAVVGFAPIFWQWVRSEERMARRADEQADRRAARAAHPSVPAGPAVPAPAGSAWEAYWLARTGRVPSVRSKDAAPEPPPS